MNATERIKLAIPLLKALADGKALEWQSDASGTWHRTGDTLNPIVVLENPDRYRIAPDLPEKPSQEWLDKHGVEITGECRAPIVGELVRQLSANGEWCDFPPVIAFSLGSNSMQELWGHRWILRKRQTVLPPRPSVEDVMKLRTSDGRMVRLTGECIRHDGEQPA